MTKLSKVFSLVGLVLIIDQVVKIWVKTHMYIGQRITIFPDWFHFHFTENNGMAFGMEFGGDTGKIILTLIRILAVGGLLVYLLYLNRKKAPLGLLLAIGLVIAGAIGNIIDSAFYGIIFNTPNYGELATLFPDGGGYAPFLMGKVVDMMYFPLFNVYLPSWLPFWGGNDFTFFSPIFNIADSSITIGVLIILVFQKRFARKMEVGEIPVSVDSDL